MDLLKRENWFLCLFLNFITGGLSSFFLAIFIGCYDENAWYAKWQYWVFGGLCFIFPAIIMFFVFLIQIECSVASKLEVSGSDIYNTPYSWILCIIVPVVGWILLVVMIIYLFIWTHIKLKQGYGEKYIN